jgi:NTE family protein
MEKTTMTAKPRPATKTINLALQGGGAHGAYTWGVLDRLLEDERIVIEGISATSAGAMNAAALAQGLTDGGAAGARATLEAFWRSVSRTTSLSPLQPTWLDRWFGNWNMDYSPAYLAFDLLTRTFSPNQFNPLGLNPLRDLLLETIDFERLRCCTAVKLFVSATNVRTGQIKVFKTEEISADVLMASACLPFLHRTVAIDGEHYWDGGYMGNPAIFPLIYDCAAPDVVIVRINPIRRDDLPRSAREILSRANEISFNASLLRELRAIGFVTRLIDQGLIKEGALKRVLIHGIDAEDYMARLGYSSKLNPAWDFLLHLRDLGRESAGRWLETSFDRLGLVSSLECDGTLGREAALLSRVTTQAGSRVAPYAGQTQTSAEPSHPTFGHDART